jgi:hypothetical protein
MSHPKILYLYKQENAQARLLAETLRNTLKDRNIVLANLGLSALLFDKKYDLLHLFLTTAEISASLVKKLRGKTNVLQTLLNPVEKPGQYKEILFGHRLTVFSEQEKAMLAKAAPDAVTEVIPPCFPAPLATALLPSSETRRKFEVGERFMVVAVGDLSSKPHFDAYMYAAREYQRKGVYRFLIPLLKKDKESRLWGDRLKYSVGVEQLSSTVILEDQTDVISLMDAADLVLYLNKKPELQFEFLPLIIPALLLGKALFCYNVPPINEVVAPVRSRWVANATEDFVRESIDLQKQAVESEQISTELARAARQKFNPESVASRYDALYKSILSTTAPAGKGR